MARNGKDIAEPKKAVSRKHDWASDMSMDIGASLSTGQFDPRQKRLDRLRKSNVLDLQTESFSQLNVPPITSYDLYHRLLRVQSTPPFKQAGAPTERDVRDMDVNTDEVSVKNADVQFSFSDDTLLLKMMELIRYRKKNKKKLGNSLRMLRQQWCATGAAASAASASSSSSGSLSSVDKNLAKFLQGASEAMERLLSERSGLRAQKSAATKQGGVFEAESDWVRVGGDTANGINELLRTRAVSCVSSSALLPSLLLCAYPSPANTDEDLRPHKVRPRRVSPSMRRDGVLGFVWDMGHGLSGRSGACVGGGGRSLLLRLLRHAALRGGGGHRRGKHRPLGPTRKKQLPPVAVSR